MLKGWKTLALGLGVTIVGALQGFDWVDFLTADNAGWVTMGLGIAMMVLRGLTDTPAGSDKPKTEA